MRKPKRQSPNVNAFLNRLMAHSRQQIGTDAQRTHLSQRHQYKGPFSPARVRQRQFRRGKLCIAMKDEV
jgi:hypothetical protein